MARKENQSGSEGPWQCLWSWLAHGSERFPGGHCGNPGWHRGNPRGPERNPGWHRGILWGLNGIQGGTGVFLAEKFESPTRCVESLAPPIGPRPFEPVQNQLERMACPAKTSIYAIKAATKAGKALLLLALRWIINPFHGLASLFRPCRGLVFALLFCLA